MCACLGYEVIRTCSTSGRTQVRAFYSMLGIEKQDMFDFPNPVGNVFSLQPVGFGEMLRRKVRSAPAEGRGPMKRHDVLLIYSPRVGFPHSALG